MPQDEPTLAKENEDLEDAPEQPEVHQVVVTTDEQGIPTGVTPVGVQRTALPAVLRMAAKMVDQYLEL